MILTLFIVGAWLSVLCFACLPKKLPAVVNALLYLSLSIIDINRLTIFISLVDMYKYSKKMPEFISFVVNRDIVTTVTLIAFANAYLTAETRKKRIAAALLSYLYLIGINVLLHAFHVLNGNYRNALLDLLCYGILMVISVLLGRFFMRITKKEGQCRGERHL